MWTWGSRSEYKPHNLVVTSELALIQQVLYCNMLVTLIEYSTNSVQHKIIGDSCVSL